QSLHTCAPPKKTVLAAATRLAVMAPATVKATAPARGPALRAGHARRLARRVRAMAPAAAGNLRPMLPGPATARPAAATAAHAAHCWAQPAPKAERLHKAYYFVFSTAMNETCPYPLG